MGQGEKSSLNSDTNHEYDLLAESIRHNENLFFANLTVSVTVFGGMGTVFLYSKPLPIGFSLALGFSGSLLAILLGANNYRFLTRWYKLVGEAARLEQDQSFKYRHFSIIQPCLPLGMIGWTCFYVFAWVVFSIYLLFQLAHAFCS